MINSPVVQHNARNALAAWEILSFKRRSAVGALCLMWVLGVAMLAGVSPSFAAEQGAAQQNAALGSVAPEKAAPLACSGVTAYSALKKVADTLSQAPVVMIGAGGVGLMALALHKKMGGQSAIVVDIDPAKREAAKAAGTDGFPAQWVCR